MLAAELGIGTTGCLARLPPMDFRLLWATLALVGALLIGAILVGLVDRWRKRADLDRVNSKNQLAHFRTLYEQGELSLEEFERVQKLLTGRIVKALTASTQPVQEVPPAPDGATSQAPSEVSKTSEPEGPKP
jgi:hypothetical protein